MKSIKILISALFILSQCVFADTQFKQSVGFPDAYSEFLSGCETPDSSYVFLGNTSDTVSQTSKIFLVKMNAGGTVLWSKTYQYPVDAFGIKVAAAANGELVIMGYTYQTAAPFDDIFLIRTQSDGTILWSKLYGGADIDEGNDMIIDAQGNIVVAGYTYSFGTALKSAFVVKTDPNGAYSWSKTYSQNTSQEFNGIIQTNDNGYMITGFTQLSPGFNFDGYMVKTDSAGVVEWSKRTGGSLSEILYKCWQDTSGQYYFSGSASTNTLSGNQDGWLLSVNSSGSSNVINYTYGTSIADRTYSITAPPGGHSILLSGYAQSNSGFEGALFLPVNKTDGMPSGSALFGGATTGNARAYASFYSTSGLVQAGYIYTATEPLGSAYVIKYPEITSPCQIDVANLDIANQNQNVLYTDSFGTDAALAAANSSNTTFTANSVNPGQNIFCILSSVSTIDPDESVSIFPNPVQEVLNIETHGTGISRIKIMDINGKILSDTYSGNDVVVLPVSKLAAGAYQVMIQNGNNLLHKKFIKVD